MGTIAGLGEVCAGLCADNRIVRYSALSPCGRRACTAYPRAWSGEGFLSTNHARGERPLTRSSSWRLPWALSHKGRGLSHRQRLVHDQRRSGRPGSAPRRAPRVAACPGRQRWGWRTSRFKQLVDGPRTRLSWGHSFALSRHACPRLASSWPSQACRGRGECRALAAPMARLRKKCRRQEPQVQPRHPGIPRAMVFTLIRSLPGARLVGHHAATMLAHCAVDTSFGVSGRCDFTSASDRSSAPSLPRDAAISRGHRIPASRVVTIARNAPSA